MTASQPRRRPIKVGVIADQTGPLAVIGLANANVARMVVGDINAKGGLLGRHLELHLEDSATDDAVAAAKAAKLVEDDQVDVILGGIYSSTRQAIKGPAVVEGRTLYIYPEQYEGQESDPLIFCTGPVPAQQVDPFIPWLMRETGAKTLLPAVRRLHLAARDERAGPRGRHRQRRGDRRRGVLPARPRGLPGDGRADRRDRRRRRLQHDRAARGRTVPRAAARLRLRARGGQLVCTYFEENLLGTLPAAHVDGLYSCLDYYHSVDDPFSRRLLAQYDALYPGTRSSPAAAGPRACTAGSSSGRRPSRRRGRSSRTT